jgi:phosphoglycolate phosphatase-like HAD superfamily hydrolase
MKHEILAVIFDFDYTLADSSYGAMECINFALEALSIPPASYEVVCRTIGLSIPETFLSLAGPEHHQENGEFARLFKQRADEGLCCKNEEEKKLSVSKSSQSFLDCHSKQLGDQSNLASHIPFVYPL